MEPTLQGLVQAQTRFLSGLTDTMATICDNPEIDITDDEYKTKIEQCFQDISKLSITSEVP